MAKEIKEVTEINEPFGKKLLRLWPVYLMEGVIWVILAAIVYFIIFG